VAFVLLLLLLLLLLQLQDLLQLLLGLRKQTIGALSLG
jgi:hypothetical protein